MEIKAEDIWKRWHKKVVNYDSNRLDEKKLKSAIKKADKDIKKQLVELERDIFWQIFYHSYNIKIDFKPKGKSN